jgi:hypothetical protein
MKTKFEVWYMRPEFARFDMEGDCPDPRHLSKTHIHLKTLELEGGSAQLERVFHEMQGEIWSPNGEARELIRSKGLRHTSMSIGDVIVVDGRVNMVASMGFRELER